MGAECLNLSLSIPAPLKHSPSLCGNNECQDIDNAWFLIAILP